MSPERMRIRHGAPRLRPVERAAHVFAHVGDGFPLLIVLHAYFIAIVQHRRAAEREEQREGRTELFPVPAKNRGQPERDAGAECVFSLGIKKRKKASLFSFRSEE